MKSTTISLFTLGLVLTFAPSAAKAQLSPNPPGQISYQGFLTDANGFPLATNNPVNYNVQFRIYNASTSGTLQWGESQVVTVDRGYFTVMLGNGSILSGVTNTLAGVFSGSDASDRYLEMTVQGLAPAGSQDMPIQPRLRLLASPYSFLASRSLVAESVAPSTAVADANLSQNVALRNASQTFTGVNTFNNAVGISGKNILEFDAGDSAKGQDAGTIGYQVFDNALDIVGAGTAGNRKIKFWAEGGADFSGGVNFEGAANFPAGANFTGGASFPGGANFSGEALFGGNVGIGTSSPLVPLHVSSSSAIPVALIDGSGTAGTWLTLRNTASGGTNWMLISAASGNGVDAGKLLFTYGSGPNYTLGTAMALVPGGLVGIGTTTPAVPLDVESSVNQSASYGWLNVHGQTSTASGNNPYSIKAGQRIMASEFNAVSDSRIKEIIGQSDRQADLEIIQKLRVTDYHMKDRVANGDTPCKGFIAQEVETVIPEAVTKSRQFVPDIYAAASGAKFDPAARTIALKLAKAHGLKTGDRVRLMTEAGQLDLPVSSVPSEQEFVATNCEKEPKQVFVFGREVNDFRTLNYDRIFTTGISAMQELARRVSALEEHEAEHVALEKRAARVDELEHEVADLKAVVARLAERKEQQASARGVSEQPATSEPSGALVALDNAGRATQLDSTAQPGE
jgi:hypothetical protein